jgi:hypothetical protein
LDEVEKCSRIGKERKKRRREIWRKGDLENRK